MKGFPNQVADLNKLATGMQALVRVLDGGQDAANDGVLGAELVRAGVAGTGHAPMPIDAYLELQRSKSTSNQSFRTTARGLRELYRLFGFIDDSGARVIVTPTGRQAAHFAGAALGPEQIEFWRRVIRNVAHGGGQTEESHPYQVLLRLVGRMPGITRAKCALALEARNDTAAELDRIAALADYDEDVIRARIGVSQSNWDNAKKVLPSLAEQLGDVAVVVRDRVKTYRLADAPGKADVPDGPGSAPPFARPPTATPRAPRSSRSVTPETIGRAGTADRSDEVAPPPPSADPAAAAAAIRLRQDRLRRHNLLVQALARRLAACGARLHEDPFDILALIDSIGILVEVKSLDGTDDDERLRVRDALSQLLYYEAFAAAPIVRKDAIRKIACFERPISEDHRVWLNTEAEIGVIWATENGGFAWDNLAAGILRPYLEQLR